MDFKQGDARSMPGKKKSFEFRVAGFELKEVQGLSSKFYWGGAAFLSAISHRRQNFIIRGGASPASAMFIFKARDGARGVWEGGYKFYK